MDVWLWNISRVTLHEVWARTSPGTLAFLSLTSIRHHFQMFWREKIRQEGPTLEKLFTWETNNPTERFLQGQGLTADLPKVVTFILVLHSLTVAFRFVLDSFSMIKM